MLRAYRQLLRSNRNFRLLWDGEDRQRAGRLVLFPGGLSPAAPTNRQQSAVRGARGHPAGVAHRLHHPHIGVSSTTANGRSRKAIMIVADIARFFIVLGMLTVRTPGMVWLVYPLLLFETLGAAFFEPAHSAVIPSIVEPCDVLAANALASITWSFCLAVGASLGGIVAVLAGRDAVFLLNALSFLASAWLIRRMKFEEPHTAGHPELHARDFVDFTPVVEGARYIRSNPDLFVTVFVKGGINFPPNVLLPMMGQRVFPVHIEGLDPGRAAMLGMSLLMGARGAGSLLGPLVSGRWARDHLSRLRTPTFFLSWIPRAAAGCRLLCRLLPRCRWPCFA